MTRSIDLQQVKVCMLILLVHVGLWVVENIYQVPNVTDGIVGRIEIMIQKTFG